MFIEDILKHKSVAIVGLAKNAGKTECLNYILSQIRSKKKRFALTSIGIDGESCDLVTQTPKPEICIYEDMLFITSEKHYHQKQLVAEVMDVGTDFTALGRLVTAKAITRGKVLLSGPANTFMLKNILKDMDRYGVDTTLVDGALSRLSPASPAITDAMILVTGASVSANIPQLVRKTRYIYDLILLEAVDQDTFEKLYPIENGIQAIDEAGELHDLEIPSAFMLERYKENLFRHGTTLYAAGAVSDKLLQFLKSQKHISETTLIIRDFTKMFASMETFYAYLKKGGKIKVVQKSKLLAVCVNPQSPEGFILDSEELRNAMEKSLQLPVYDVRQMPVNTQSPNSQKICC